MASVEPIRDYEKMEQIRAILKRQSMRNWYLFVLGTNFGARISDLLPLRVRDVQGKKNITVIEQKTKKPKKLMVLPGLEEATDEYTKGMKPNEYLFKSKRTQKPISRVQAYRILNSVAAEVGLEQIGTHTLRKTFGYHFYKRTLDVAILQDLFNHSSPSITLRYIGINDDMRDEAMKKFAGLF